MCIRAGVEQTTYAPLLRRVPGSQCFYNDVSEMINGLPNGFEIFSEGSNLGTIRVAGPRIGWLDRKLCREFFLPFVKIALLNADIGGNGGYGLSAFKQRLHGLALEIVVVAPSRRQVRHRQTPQECNPRHA
jgi:hypothetical protein